MEPADDTKQGDARAFRARLVPFLVLVGVVAVFGTLFYRVIHPLLLPLFLAAVVAMLAHPLQNRMTAYLWGNGYLAAAVVTLLVVLAILGPLGTASYQAVRQLAQAVKWLQQRAAEDELRPMLDPKTNPTLGRAVEWIESVTTIKVENVGNVVNQVASGSGKIVYERSQEFLGDVARFVLGMVMFLIALYFFLVDGTRIVAAWEELTPLDAEHDRVIRTEFSKVCRGVVLATVFSALAQGALFGIGVAVIDLFARAGLWRWLFLLSLMTTVFALIPFLGAASIWLPTALFLLLQGHYAAGTVLILYGALIISTSDNVLKVLVIKDAANLHPLLVLVCVFGGLQLVGLLGVFIGPIVGAVLFALLRILKKELLHLPGLGREAAGPG